MTNTSRTVVRWSPRILGILTSLLIGAFALDARNEGTAAYLLHLAPALLLLLIVGASWRWKWLAGVVFIALAVLYSVIAWRHLDWLLVISGPLLLTGLLFLWSWRTEGDGRVPVTAQRAR